MFSCLHLTSDSACIHVSCSSASVNGKSRLLHFDWLFQTFWHWQVLLSRYAKTEHAKWIIIFEWSGPFVWADGRIYAHLLQSILYYRKGRCTNETCHLSDCAMIIYVYSFKGKHFSLSICATYLFNGSTIWADSTNQQNTGPHCTAAHRENSRCSRWPFRHCFCVFDSLSAIRHERELSLVLMCCETDAFCACTSDPCAQKTLYQKFKLIWFKMHDFSMIDMIIKTKHMFFSRVYGEQAVKAQLYSGKGGGEQQLICI